MKVAFDEHIPPQMYRLFQSLSGSPRVDHQIVAAKDYRPDGEIGDAGWVSRFASDGGQVVISGDVRMRGRPHELKALQDCGLITVFFHRRWSQQNFFVKSAMLIKWWPQTDEHIRSIGPASCWEIPFSWTGFELKDVTQK
ncbi:hypothetical protein [Minwuia sp.]|uniref:PIN-like domain-containing protein n=1 Tax=Minwuia sp. TaxID=2493630 RepID=UPI003A942652